MQRNSECCMPYGDLDFMDILWHLTNCRFIIRPPGTTVPDGLMFYPWCYPFSVKYSMCLFMCLLFISPRVLRDPWTDRPETLPHGRNLTEFYNPTPKIRGLSPQQFGGEKHAKFRSILDHFKIWSRISPERLKISKIGNFTKYRNSSCVRWKKSRELWWTNGLELHVSMDPLKCTFWYMISRPLWGAAPWNLYTS